MVRVGYGFEVSDLAERLRPLSELADALHARDRAFFYSRLVIEEVLG